MMPKHEINLGLYISEIISYLAIDMLASYVSLVKRYDKYAIIRQSTGDGRQI